MHVQDENVQQGRMMEGNRTKDNNNAALGMRNEIRVDGNPNDVRKDHALIRFFFIFYLETSTSADLGCFGFCRSWGDAWLVHLGHTPGRG